MKTANLGKIIETGKNFVADVDRLIETRLLIQANSGGGKSYAIRKLVEVTHGMVQQIIFDYEGEFSTLREKFDFIIAGKGGDVSADPKTAELLARKILELEVSLIVDLSELKAHERHLFVKNFLDALMNSPRELWHPVVVVIDEAHLFVPEKGQSQAMNAVTDLATRGRKRGFCAVLATQRLSKLHKDVAAECINKLVGRTGLDIDMKRAGDELGFSGRESILSLRDLEAGEFFAFGPAFSKIVTKIKIGEVESKHPRAGQRIRTAVMVPTARVKEILGKLSNLPKEAEEELRDKAALTAKIRELERAAKQIGPSAKDIEEIKKKITADTQKEFEKKFKSKFNDSINTVKAKLIETLSTVAASEVFKDLSLTTTPRFDHRDFIKQPATVRTAKTSRPIKEEDSLLGKCERQIISFLLLRPQNAFSKVQIGTMTGYSNSSGGFNNAISRLSQLGLIQRAGSNYKINSDRIDEAANLTDGEFHGDTRMALESWLGRLQKCPKEIYHHLLVDPDKAWTKDELGDATGYSSTSGGFNNSISQLNTLGLIQKNGDGTISINQEILRI